MHCLGQTYDNPWYLLYVCSLLSHTKLVEVVQSFFDHNPWDVTREKQSPDINAVQPSGTIDITRVYRTHSPSPSLDSEKISPPRRVAQSWDDIQLD